MDTGGIEAETVMCVESVRGLGRAGLRVSSEPVVEALLLSPVSNLKPTKMNGNEDV